MSLKHQIRWQGRIDRQDVRLVLLEHISNGRFVIQTARQCKNSIETVMIWDDVKERSAGGTGINDGESEYSKLLTAITTELFKAEWKAHNPDGLIAANE